MKNFNAKDIKTLNSEIKTLTVSVKGAVKLYAELLPHAVFHASNSEGASGRLTALNQIMFAMTLFKTGDKYIAGIKAVVSKSIHKVKYDTSKKQFVFSEQGASARKKRNLKEGFETLSFLDHLPEGGKSSGTAPITSAQLIGRFNKVMEQNENNPEVILTALAEWLSSEEMAAKAGQFAAELTSRLEPAAAEQTEAEQLTSPEQAEQAETEADQSAAA